VSTIDTSDQTLYYTVTNSGDFGTSSGSFSLSSNAGSFSVTPTADTTTEGAETFTASVRIGSTSGDIIATTPSITINDTSLTAATPAVTFDGTGDYYSATGLTTTATDSKYMTVAFTFYLPSSATGSFMDLFAIRLGTANGEVGYHAILQSTRLHSYFVNPGNSTGQTYGDFEITASNAWHQIVYYHDATSFSNCKYYVDGVDRTSSSLLNGPSFGEPAMQNVDFNWGTTGAKVYIGNGIIGTGFDASDEFDGRLSQVYLHNASGAPTISNYWDTSTSKPKNLGTNGTATGLAQPLIYHYGNTSTFPTNNGTGFNSYTLTANGNVTSADGPTYA
jgi:hypothetical protein